MIVLQNAFRIGIHLPFRDEREERAVKDATNYFKFKYDGSTYSNVVDPSYIGTWKSKVGVKFEADLCLLNIDTLVGKKDEGKHSVDAKAKAMVSQIVEKTRKFYAMVGRPQISFWVTVTEMKISSAG